MTSRSESWDRRIQRADRLASESGSAAPLLSFYLELLRQQQVVHDSFDERPPAGSIEADAPRIAASGDALLHAVAERGPDQLAAEARLLLDRDAMGRAEELFAYWHTR